ncbi:MAG: hypothetical protein J3Q66DRAFT_388179 [Benniella sp.]|nr:MAG: hypothetical protein J3Q66DRAFT_388179 [Benniella sp.]
MFVVYGADSMTSEGFRVQVHDVFQTLHSGTQAVFLSTKMLMEVTEVMAKFKREPIRIVIKKGDATESKADLRDHGRGKGMQAGNIVPPMGNDQSLTHDKVGKGRKHPATTIGGHYHKGHTKKNDLTQEHSKDSYLPLTSGQWPQRDEIVDNQDEVGVDGDDIDGNQGEIDANDDRIDGQGRIDHKRGEIIDSFDNMNLKPELIRGINVYGVLNPIKGGNLKIGFVKMIFVYEADEMNSNGFGDPIHDVFQRLHPVEKDTGAEWYEEFLRIHGVETEGTQAVESVPSMGNAQFPSNRHGKEGAEARDSLPPVANVHSPSNGHGQEGTEAGHSVPPVGKVYRLTQDNLLQHQLRYGDHKVDESLEIEHAKKEYPKKDRWTLEQIKQLYV